MNSIAWYEWIIALVPVWIVAIVVIHGLVIEWRNPGLREQLELERKELRKFMKRPTAIVRKMDWRDIDEYNNP